TWLPQQGLGDALPFVVIIVVMALRSRTVLARGGETTERNPSIGRPHTPLRTAAACFVVGVILMIALSGVLRFAFISSLTVTCVALSVVVLTGYVGQVSLAQMSLAGIGGFMLGHISHGWGLGFPFGLNLAANSGRSTNRVVFGVMVLVVVILLGLLVARLRRGPAGRMLLAIRSNERAAGSVGINVAQAKLMAFGLAAFIAGIGGALTGYMQGELTADSFAAFTSISLLAIVFVAGVGRIAGAVVAGVMFSAAGLFVTFLNIHLNVGKYQAIVAGIALVLTAVQNPDGITSTSTGKGPAVAIEKLQGRLVGQYRKRRPGRVEEEAAVHDDHQTRAGMG